jgi:hypothetical protein
MIESLWASQPLSFIADRPYQPERTPSVPSPPSISVCDRNLPTDRPRSAKFYGCPLPQPLTTYVDQSKRC